jgi:hypothetical protein
MQQWRPAMDMIYLGLAALVFLSNAVIAINLGKSPETH